MLTPSCRLSPQALPQVTTRTTTVTPHHKRTCSHRWCPDQLCPLLLISVSDFQSTRPQTGPMTACWGLCMEELHLQGALDSCCSPPRFPCWVLASTSSSRCCRSTMCRSAQWCTSSHYYNTDYNNFLFCRWCPIIDMDPQEVLRLVLDLTTITSVIVNSGPYGFLWF